MERFTLLFIVFTTFFTGQSLKCYQCTDGDSMRENFYGVSECIKDYPNDECTTSDYCIKVKKIDPQDNSTILYDCGNTKTEIPKEAIVMKCKTDYCNSENNWIQSIEELSTSPPTTSSINHSTPNVDETSCANISTSSFFFIVLSSLFFI